MMPAHSPGGRLPYGGPHLPWWWGGSAGGGPLAGGEPLAGSPLGGGVPLACEREKPLRKSCLRSSPIARRRSPTLLVAAAVVSWGGSIKNQRPRKRRIPVTGGTRGGG